MKTSTEKTWTAADDDWDVEKDDYIIYEDVMNDSDNGFAAD